MHGAEPSGDGITLKRDGDVVTGGDDIKDFDEAQDALDLAIDQQNLPSSVAAAQACKKKGALCGPFAGGCNCGRKCKNRALGIGQGSCR